MPWIHTFLAGLSALTGALPQNATNGVSKLGTLEASTLPHFLTNNPLPHGVPWGKTIPYEGIPKTGVTRHYEFTVARGFKAPDGVNKSVILVNGQFPGPLIEANWGDEIEVKVTNHIDGPAEGLSLHWHGQPQKLTPWADGVPSVSQCPIAPRSSFTYKFVAESYGSSWWHSHVSAQYMDGLYGPMIVYGPSHQPYDIDLGPVMVSDYSHQPYFEMLENILLSPPHFPTVHNNLINGKGIFDCSVVAPGKRCTPNAGLSKFKFKTGETHRLRLINVGSAGSQKFSIDNHEMTVIANDYVDVQPYTTKVVTLGIGQRADVLVKATGKPTDAVWMRADLDLNCLNLTSTQSHGLAAIYYPHADHDDLPNTQATPWESHDCTNDPLEQTVPYYPLEPPRVPSVTQQMVITNGDNSTGAHLFFVNGQSFHANYNYPILLLENNGNTSYPYDPEWNVYNFGKNTSIRIVFYNYFHLVHPMHLHGHDFWVLAEGHGTWDGRVINSENPQRRDVAIMRPGSVDVPSYLVIEFMADNPGVWPLHCHIAVHVSEGLYVNIMERPDKLHNMEIPYVMAQTCRDWAKWSGTNYVNEIDSGL